VIQYTNGANIKTKVGQAQVAGNISKQLNPNNQMKKTLLFIAMLFAGMLIAGTIDESTRQLEQQPNTINK
jgi:hypothetical protein